MDLEPNEEVVHQFAVPDPEFGSYMAAELDRVENIEKDIAKLEYKVGSLKAQAHYIASSVWQQFWDKYPGNHPTDFKSGISKLKYDRTTHTAYFTKMKPHPVDRMGERD